MLILWREQMKESKLINIPTIPTNDAGALSFFEAQRTIPFQINRIYYIYNVKSEVKRGGHAHKELQQILFCPYGSIEILLDNGVNKESVLLDSPEKGLVLDRGIWRDMIWHQDYSVLCVAASDYYNENDYIREYNEFIRLVKEGYWNE